MASSPSGSGGSTAGTPGKTSSAGLSYAPRLSRNVGRRSAISSITMTVGKLAHRSSRSRSRTATSLHASRISGGAYWFRKASRSFSACAGVRRSGGIRAMVVIGSAVATTPTSSGLRAAP